MSTIEEIIKLFNLTPLQEEGGLFIQSYKSDEFIPAGGLPERYPVEQRAFGTAIYYLLTSDGNTFSAMHMLPTDEVYHFYLGDPVEMLLLYPDGSSRRVILGQDILNGQKVQFIAPRGVWQGSYVLPGGSYALMGTTMAPAYEDSDYSAGKLQELLVQYPQEAELITRLTRG